MCGHLWPREQVFFPLLSTCLRSGPSSHLSFLLPAWVGMGPRRASLLPQTLSSSGCYSLSVRLSRPASWDRIRHYRIQCLDNGWLYISPRLTFPSLQALVDHYSGTAFPLDWDVGSGGQTVVPLDTLPAGEYPDRQRRDLSISMPVPVLRT